MNVDLPLPNRPAVKLYRDLDQLPVAYRGGAVAIGNFDGVHRGHACIVERLLAMARTMQAPALAFTFDPHPARLLHPEQAPAPLCWTERKAQLLVELGVDAVLAYPTDKGFLGMEARQFFDQIVRGRLQARGMVEGSNFFFGHNRGGTVEVLRQFCNQSGLLLERVESVEIDGQIVSSSLIRRLVVAGRLEEAGRLLTRPYRIRGTVVHGAGRGNRLGYPTANVEGIDTLLPGEGIYAGRVWLGDSCHAAAVSIGPNPTFHEQTLKVEAYVLDFQGDLYDRPIELDFLARLRDMVRFDSAAQLVAEMARDVETTRRLCATYSSTGPQAPNTATILRPQDSP
jgi:riboflavin kinase/FMN adenylyltransferase